MKRFGFRIISICRYCILCYKRQEWRREWLVHSGGWEHISRVERESNLWARNRWIWDWSNSYFCNGLHLTFVVFSQKTHEIYKWIRNNYSTYCQLNNDQKDHVWNLKEALRTRPLCPQAWALVPIWMSPIWMSPINVLIFYGSALHKQQNCPFQSKNRLKQNVWHKRLCSG